MDRRAVDVVVISDVHPGTYGCRAKELVAYLKSIEPNILILNGDFIDGWQFTKRYFPTTHMAVRLSINLHKPVRSFQSVNAKALVKY